MFVAGDRAVVVLFRRVMALSALRKQILCTATSLRAAEVSHGSLQVKRTRHHRCGVGLQACQTLGQTLIQVLERGIRKGILLVLLQLLVLLGLNGVPIL